FPKFVKTLRQVHQTGLLPDSFRSKEKLNIRNDIEIEAHLESLIKQLSGRIVEKDGNSKDKDEKNGVSNINSTGWKFVLVDGFLLYWDIQVIKELDIKLFVQADYTTLKKRREERAGYVTADGYWTDPPNYFDTMVWPNYVKSYKRLFQGHSEIKRTINELVVLNSNCKRDISMNLEMAVENVLEFVKGNEVQPNSEKDYTIISNVIDWINLQITKVDIFGFTLRLYHWVQPNQDNKLSYTPRLNEQAGLAASADPAAAYITATQPWLSRG
ncbi:7058_t:CDS:2, partial [Scutellospora calospora]